MSPMGETSSNAEDRILDLEKEVSRLRARVVELESKATKTTNVKESHRYEEDSESVNRMIDHIRPVETNGCKSLASACGQPCSNCVSHLAEPLLQQPSTPSSPGEDTICIPRATLELLHLKERAMDAIKEGITIADATLPDMPLIYINEGFSRITGYPVEYAQNKNCRFLQGEGTDPNTVNSLKDAIKRGEGCVVQITNYKRSGDPFINYLSLTPIKDNSGQLSHYVGIQSDITELVQQRNAELAAKHQAAEAAAATEAKSQFLARMSHEIRTPLNGMIAVGQLLAETQLTPQQWDLVNTIRCSGEALLTLISDILDFSKIEANKMELSISPFFLESTLEAAVEIAGMHAGQKRLHVAYYVHDDVPSCIRGDAHRLQQILLNILNNAVKFTDQGDIFLEVWSQPAQKVCDMVPEDEIHFRVIDSGIGIAPPDLARLFRSFSQLDTTPTRKFGGSGLGLTISQKLCEAMGGQMWATSDGLGTGSTFRWYIKTQRVQGKLPQVQLNPLNKGDDLLIGRKVLLVERCDMVRKVMFNSLRRWGCQVKAVKDQSTAISCLRLRKDAYTVESDVEAQEQDAVTSLSYQTFSGLPEGEGSVQSGPFDVVIMDVKCSALLQTLLHCCDVDEAKRAIFLGWPGEEKLRNNCRDLAQVNSVQKGVEGSAGTICPVGEKNSSIAADCKLSLPEHLEKLCSLNPNEEITSSLSHGSPLHGMEDAQNRCTLGFVVVSRPVRQGRLKLGLQEVLDLDLVPMTSSSNTEQIPLQSPTRVQSYNDRAKDSFETWTGSDGHSEQDSDPGRSMSMASTGSLLQAPLRKIGSSNSLDSELVSNNASRRLLLAEDNIINMKVALGILRRLGFTSVDVVGDGEEAIQIVQAAGGPGAFYAILMDLHMPRMGGIEAVKEIRRLYPQQSTKIIAVTADAFEDTRDTCVANGFTGWLAKPFRVEEFAKIMSREK